MLAIQWPYYHNRDHSDLLKEQMLCDGYIADCWLLMYSATESDTVVLAEAGFAVDEFIVI